ncbi:hypothetical protein CORC01_14418 [Colletotrichum orchidophilum]|uniref:Uncharacterized protein n=1 Tax=Colletotrichum orchidophilum TaxID=1209926 RepID=A0A1G4AM93_9PEZI|nr:uncharacterized protein CORC01_14418 [Colletotrichum orchidophilum]OHE90289.1 hypothetical protein CORC01_14418 [Colletotrichum orchidophilum]
MWRCEQIRRRYGADVYVQVRFKSKSYEYTSSNEHNFPRSRAELNRDSDGDIGEPSGTPTCGSGRTSNSCPLTRWPGVLLDTR